jgi:serine/threonine-protein kinase
MRNLDGQTIGSYLVIEQTAVGGMAIIYKAYDAALDRYVALKVLPEYLSHEPEFSARFRAEARNIARLRHPNILPIYGYGEENGLSYFVMDLVEGGTLKNLMGGPMPVEQAVTLINQVADALQYAHVQGVVHRDVKPANVLMARPDWVQLSDFGIARVLEQNTNLTHSGSAFFGTPHYMAPEQARGDPVSPQTDQYALGIVLYEMLTGTTPYSADTPQAIVYQHIYSALPLPHTRNPLVTDVMERVILKALAKEQQDRFPDMAAFALAARAAAGGASVPMTAAVPQPTEEVEAESEPFPPKQATNAFVPIPPAPVESGTELFESPPVVPGVRTLQAPEAKPKVSKPPRGGPPAGIRSKIAGWPRWWPIAAGGAVAVLAVGGIAFVALGSSSNSPVPVSIVAPRGASLGDFTVLKPDGTDVKDVSGAGGHTTVRLPPGRYALSFSSSPFRMPVPFSVSGGSADLRLAQLGSFVHVRAPGHSIPSFSVYDTHDRDVSDVDAAGAKSGVYLLAGKYKIQFQYNSHYSGEVPLTVAAAGPQALNLDRSMTYFKVVPPHGLPLSGIEVDHLDGKYIMNLNDDAANVGGTQAIPAGSYTLSLGSPFLGPVPFKGRAGSTTVLRIANLYARLLVVPPAGVPPPGFSLNDPKTNADKGDVKGTDGQTGVFVKAGRYLVSFDSASQFVTPLPITLVKGQTEKLRLAAVFGKITVTAFPGTRLPTFDLADIKSKKTLIYGADNVRAEEGLYVSPGPYEIVLDSAPGYLDSVAVTALKGKAAAVHLGRELAGLQLVPLPQVKLAQFDIDNLKGQSVHTVSTTAPDNTVYLRPGRYRLDLSSTSNLFIGLPAVNVALGHVARVRLRELFATVDVPAAAGGKSLTYTWNDGLGSREIDATSKRQTFFVVPGSYSIAVNVNGQGRLAHLQLAAGRVTRLPTQ